jgi:hypothetical protein
MQPNTDETRESTAYSGDQPTTVAQQPAVVETSAARASDRSDFLGVLNPGIDNKLTEERRIRPDELADALSKIERRQHKVFTGTLPLGYTLRELKMDVSPTEVWQEVEANRLAKSNPRQTPRKFGKDRYLKAGVGVLAVLASAVAIRSFLAQNDAYQATQAPVGITSTFLQPAHTVPVTAPTPIVYKEMSSFIFVKTRTMKPLREIKDGEIVPMDMMRFQEISRIASGDSTYAPAPQNLLGTVYLDTKQNPGDFETVRLDGKWYIRGWTNGKPQMEPETVNRPGRWEKLSLFNHPQSHTDKSVTLPPLPIPVGASPKEIARLSAPRMTTVDTGPADIPVTIPGNAFSGYSGGGSPDHTQFDLEVDRSKLDKHYSDKWKPLPLLPGDSPQGMHFTQSTWFPALPSH